MQRKQSMCHRLPAGSCQRTVWEEEGAGQGVHTKFECFAFFENLEGAGEQASENKSWSDSIPLHNPCRDRRPRRRLETLGRLLDYPCWRSNVRSGCGCRRKGGVVLGRKRAARAADSSVTGGGGDWPTASSRRGRGREVGRGGGRGGTGCGCQGGGRVRGWVVRVRVPASQGVNSARRAEQQWMYSAWQRARRRREQRGSERPLCATRVVLDAVAVSGLASTVCGGGGLEHPCGLSWPGSI